MTYGNIYYNNGKFIISDKWFLYLYKHLHYVDDSGVSYKKKKKLFIYILE